MGAGFEGNHRHGRVMIVLQPYAFWRDGQLMQRNSFNFRRDFGNNIARSGINITVDAALLHIVWA